MNYIQWIGSACFIICFMPQVVKTIKEGHADGLSWLFLIILLVGESCYTVAVIHDFGLVWWMLANYVSNIILLLVVIYYKGR